MRIVIGSGSSRQSYPLSRKGTVQREQENDDLKTYVTRPALFRATH